MFKFFLSKIFLINLALAILLAVLFIWGIFKYIDNYTLHGETISVPQLEGLKLKEVEEILNEKKLRYVILDSIYVAKAEKGIILEQNPIANELVKENRTIYITTSRIIAPEILLPHVVELSQRMAIAKLESYGIKIKNIDLKPSENAGYVIGCKIGNKTINSGDPIHKGTSITLIVGSGTSNERVMVPYLINLTKDEAMARLMESSLNLGFTDYENCKCKTPADTLNAKVYRQSPVRSENNPINMGSSVDIYLTCDPAMMNNNTDTTETELPN